MPLSQPPPQPPKVLHTTVSHKHFHLPKPTHNNTLLHFLLTSISLHHHFLTSTATPIPTPTPTPTPTMSINPRNHNNPRNPNFSNPQSLFNWLQPRLPSDSLSTWGTSPGTKNIHNLFFEISSGETTLIDTSPLPVRNLDVVCVRVKLTKPNSDRILIESHQEMSDGSVRNRGRVLSEKMKAGEDIELAVRRAIKEELGVGSDDQGVEIVWDSYERKVEERESLSYPGLPACYVLHYVDVFIDGLPEGEFETEEEGEEGDDHGAESDAIRVKKHFWKWVPCDSV